MEPLLQLLDHQQRYVYGLRLQGNQIALALVERRGTRQHCFRLYPGAANELRICRKDHLTPFPSPLSAFPFLQEPCHG